MRYERRDRRQNRVNVCRLVRLLFRIAFHIEPFHDSFHYTILDGGLIFQFLGLSMIRGGLRGTADTAPIPREIPPGTGEEDESNSEGWWTER